MVNENRDFMMVDVARIDYWALYNTGAQINIVRPTWLMPFATDLFKNVSYAIVTSKNFEYLDVNFEICGHCKSIPCRVADYFDEEIILGTDFKYLR